MFPKDLDFILPPLQTSCPPQTNARDSRNVAHHPFANPQLVATFLDSCLGKLNDSNETAVT